MPGLDEKTGFQIGTKEWINDYRKTVNFTTPFRIPMIHEISNADNIALEIGCGSGMDTVELAERNKFVVGVDLSYENANRALQHLKALDLNGNTVVADAENLPFRKDCFDCAYSYGVLHHTPDTQKCIDQLHLVLKSQGRYCVMLYHQGLAYYLIVIVRGILQGQIFRFGSLERLFSKYYDNTPLSRAYSSRDMRRMFKNFGRVRTETYAFGAVQRNEKLKWIWRFYGNPKLQAKLGSFIHAIGVK